MGAWSRLGRRCWRSPSWAVLLAVAMCAGVWETPVLAEMSHALTVAALVLGTIADGAGLGWAARRRRSTGGEAARALWRVLREARVVR